MLLRVHDIIEGTTVDGPGFRTSIYFAGCIHRCPGCHNPQTWDPDGGREMDIDMIVSRVLELSMPVTLSGGDPLFQIDKATELCRRLKQSDINIWVYTGYLYEDICHLEPYRQLLDSIDVLVDGPFIESLKDKSLIFRGSSNQRIIDIKKTRASEGLLVLWSSDF